MADETRLSWMCREWFGEGETSDSFLMRAPLLPRRPEQDFIAKEAAELMASWLDAEEHGDVDEAKVNELDFRFRYVEVEIAPGKWQRYRTTCRVKIEYTAAKE